MTKKISTLKVEYSMCKKCREDNPIGDDPGWNDFAEHWARKGSGVCKDPYIYCPAPIITNIFNKRKKQVQDYIDKHVKNAEVLSIHLGENINHVFKIGIDEVPDWCPNKDKKMIWINKVLVQDKHNMIR